MVCVQTDFSEDDMYKIEVIKAKMRFKNNAEAVRYIVSQYESELL